ncbi:hypothetical protein [Altibacter sp. HG106]|uniref:hypothetical protein n=1 Tax=Altibacter sp. HG106 TaxID=3023937 RepID=UPI002350512E|nr:hypothetical protein [Altibacter sp. HG106]MDC7994686.1 hypothetical protein [Altibacter sp. HG106]
MLQRFIISCLLVGVLQSCSLGLTRGLVAQPPSEVTFQNPYFANTALDYVYKAQLQVYGNSFGGIMVVKKTGSETHRVVFTTEMGKTLFDFEFQKEALQIRYIIEALDRKLLIGVLENDFKMMLSQTQFPVEMFPKQDVTLYKVPDDKRWRFYEFSNPSDQLKRIIQTSRYKKKVVINFTEISDDRAKKIKIEHFNLKLTIDLYSL